MGYTTTFEGKFDLNKQLDIDTMEFLKKLANTRRMKRNVDVNLYGVEGEFYVDGGGYAGQDHESNILDYNEPPKTQPSLWLQWIPSNDGMSIQWDGCEKFYHSVDWIKYLIEKVLSPKGYILNGTVYAQGEEEDDTWSITINNNEVTTD